MPKKKTKKKISTIGGTVDREPMYRVEGDFPGLETNIDRLYELIKNKGKITVPRAAKELKAKPSNVEEWAEMLEEHKLIKIHYPMMGEAILNIYKKEEVAKKTKEKKEKPKKKPGISKRTMLINIWIAAVALLLIYIFIINPTVSYSLYNSLLYWYQAIIGNKAYLALVLIIILAVVIAVLFKKGAIHKPKIKKHHKKHKVKTHKTKLSRVALKLKWKRTRKKHQRG